MHQFTLFDAAGYPIPTFAVLTPDASWSFKLLSDKTAGGRDRLQLAGTGSVHLSSTTDPTGIVSNPDCTYAVWTRSSA